ncbi:MAG: sulfotransferase family 2 domain-containing protein [bacterium]
MSLPRPDGPIYLLHIPRTGGTTLRELIARRFPRERCFLGGSRKRFAESMAAMSAEQREQLLFVSGHYDASVGRLLGTRPRIVTMLREPAARLRSHYEIVKRMPEHRLNAEVLAGMTFLEWLDHPLGGAAEENRMTRQIAGVMDGTGARGEGEGSGDGAARLRGAALLDRARDHLADFAFFGLREAYEDSLRLLAHTFGWPPFGEPPCLNATGAPILTAAEREIVLARNSLDAELYRLAWRRFRGRVARLDFLAIPHVSAPTHRSA